MLYWLSYEASPEAGQGFICNCLSYFITAKTSFTSILYPQFTHMIFIIYTLHVIIQSCYLENFKQTFHIFSLLELRNVLCSRDLDVPRAQRIIGFFLIYPQVNGVRKSDRMDVFTHWCNWRCRTQSWPTCPGAVHRTPLALTQPAPESRSIQLP